MSNEIISLAEQLIQMHDDNDVNLVFLDATIALLGVKLSKLIIEEYKQPRLPGIN